MELIFLDTYYTKVIYLCFKSSAHHPDHLANLINTKGRVEIVYVTNKAKFL